MEQDLNVRPETIKILGKEHRENLFDTGLSKNFLDMTPKIQTIK